MLPSRRATLNAELSQGESSSDYQHGDGDSNGIVVRHGVDLELREVRGGGGGSGGGREGLS
eukprot:517062-Hanusia_phi.AAC.1